MFFSIAENLKKITKYFEYDIIYLLEYILNIRIIKEIVYWFINKIL